MTNSQALKEAKKRWGKKVRVEKILRKKKGSRTRTKDNSLGAEYRVGTIKTIPSLGAVFDVKGIGQTWEEAFRDADRVKPVR